MANELYVANIEDFAQDVVLFYNEKKYSKLREYIEYLSNLNIAKKISGTLDAFHKASELFESNGLYEFAYKTSKVANMRFGDDHIVMGDMLYYGGRYTDEGIDRFTLYQKLMQQCNSNWDLALFKKVFDYQMNCTRSGSLPETFSTEELDNDINQLISELRQRGAPQFLEEAYLCEYKNCQRKGNWGDAEQVLIRATEETALSAATCEFLYAEILYQRADYEMAIKQFRNVIQHDRSFNSVKLSNVHFHLARSLEKKAIADHSLGEKATIDEIEQAYRRALAHSRGDIKRHSEFARFYYAFCTSYKQEVDLTDLRDTMSFSPEQSERFQRLLNEYLSIGNGSNRNNSDLGLKDLIVNRLPINKFNAESNMMEI